jgi:hypothetical protein
MYEVFATENARFTTALSPSMISTLFFCGTVFQKRRLVIICFTMDDSRHGDRDDSPSQQLDKKPSPNEQHQLLQTKSATGYGKEDKSTVSYITEIGPNDVLLGRGVPFINNPGAHKLRNETLAFMIALSFIIILTYNSGMRIEIRKCCLSQACSGSKSGIPRYGASQRQGCNRT